MGRLDGKVALVTGAGSGMGSADVRLFAKEGAKVIATGRTLSKVEKVVNDIKAEFDCDIIALQHNVESKDSRQKVVEEGVKQFGPINVLVNNAGILEPTSYAEITHEAWNKVMDINAWGAFIGIATVVPYMKKTGAGSIINFSSMAAVNSAGSFTAYTASKGAVDAFSRAAAIELAPYNIRVNCILPGTIYTPMVKDAFPNAETMNIAIQAQPLKRMGTPEDIAYTVVYLASDESNFTNGTSILVDGGFNVQASGSTTRVE